MAIAIMALFLKKGFSIIELLVVVVVIAVLAAIAFPKYNKAVNETHRREAKTVLNIIRSSEQAYKIDNGRYYGFDSLDESEEANEARSELNIDIYNNDDWEYSVGVSGSDNSTATATAKRLRSGYSMDDVFMDMVTGK